MLCSIFLIIRKGGNNYYSSPMNEIGIISRSKVFVHKFVNFDGIKYNRIIEGDKERDTHVHVYSIDLEYGVGRIRLEQVSIKFRVFEEPLYRVQ